MEVKKSLIIFLLIVFSCASSDDNSNSEFAIGEWKITKRVFSGEEIEIGVCDLHVIYFFREDFVLGSYPINESSIPDQIICGTWGEIYRWEIIDENKYGRTHVCCPDEIITIYEKQSSKLIIRQNSNSWIELSRR